MSVIMLSFVHQFFAFSCLNFLLKVFNNVSECDKYGVVNSTPWSPSAWEFDNSSCKPAPYIGSVCTTHLLKWQDCTIGSSESGIVAISAEVDQNEVEQSIIAFFLEISKHFLLQAHRTSHII